MRYNDKWGSCNQFIHAYFICHFINIFYHEIRIASLKNVYIFNHILLFKTKCSIIIKLEFIGLRNINLCGNLNQTERERDYNPYNGVNSQQRI